MIATSYFLICGWNNPEEESKNEKPKPTDDPMGCTLIREVSMKSVDICRKRQQEIMH